jgi:glycine/D-amino acid oxidase-like deaminating enzyme
MRAEIVIVGAGVIGASVAWHLASRGCRKVLVVDRAPTLGGGSTPKATGGFRAQFGSEINVRLSLLSREKLLRFEEEIGVDPGYRQAGYLFLARSESELESLRRAQEIQHRCGVTEAVLIDAAEARRINPAIGDDEVIGGAYSPKDGFIRAMNILNGYVTAATRLGVRFEMSREGDSVDGDIIVNAKGAWAGDPILPLRRNVAATVPTDVVPSSRPMTIWSDGFHFRERDGRVLLLWSDDPLVEDDAWFAHVERLTRERIPSLRDVAIDRAASWSGLYEVSPDGHVLLGHRRDNLYVAIGSSGHGVMHCPAIGQLLAEIILDGRATTIDAHVLRPSRFEEGEPIQSVELL